MAFANPGDAPDNGNMLAELAARLFAGRLDVDESLESVVAGAVAALGADRASCYVPDAEGAVEAVHTTEDDPALAGRLRAATGMALADMPVWRAISQQDSAVVEMPDVAAALGPPVARALRVGSLLSVRLADPAVPDRPLGHLVVSWRATRSFGDRERALALQLAALAAPALATARAHGRTVAALDASMRAEAQMAQAQRLAGLGRWSWRPADGAVECDDRVRAMAGLPTGAAVEVDALLARTHPEDAPHMRAALRAAAADGAPIDITCRMVHPDGVVRTVALLGEVDRRDDDGAPAAYAGTAQDITRTTALEEAVRFQARLLDSVDAAVIATDMAGRIVHWNRAATAQFGWSEAEALGREAARLVVAAEDSADAAAIMATVMRDGRFEGEFTALRRDGGRVPLRINHALVHDAAGDPVGVVGVSVDISARLRAEERLRDAHDHLERVTAVMSDGLITVAADGTVTHMNDSAERALGWHAAEAVGRPLRDTLQRRVAGRPAGRLLQRLREADGALRTDDEAFVHRDGTAIPVEVRAARIRGEVGEWVIAFADATERREREARMAEDMDALRWGVRIRDALAGDGFVLHAQPIVEVATGRVVQNELLLRMVDPDGGPLIAPGHFLGVAEEHGLIGRIDAWVLGEAARLAAGGHHVQVNLSARSVSDPRMFDLLAATLRRAGADPGRLGIEVTETAIMTDPEAAVAFLRRTRDLGCGVAVDDFGTGYAGFLYLKQLPANRLKIDIEFIRDLTTNPASRHVVSAVCRLAADFRLTTVAEGVEDIDTLHALRDLGVDYAQGYGICRPGPLPETLGRIGRVDVPSAGWWGARAPGGDAT